METIIEMFAVKVSSTKIKKLEDELLIDKMANARQAMSTHFTISLEKINSCRIKLQLSKIE